ncbi:MAG: hypothetical protein KAV97_01595 [Actinomycetia bacterium]|jgi:hypothetical protein|nr:hypothetical protein [Actinomycetes bacterium]
MKRKYFFVILFLILAIFLVGCGGVTTPSVNLTGNWTMTNSSDSGVTTSKCNIVDSSGSLTLYNFYIIDQEYISWNTGYGTFNNSAISANISGSYINIYGSTVSTIVYFEGTIASSGISGSGTWVQTFSVSGEIYSYSGTTIFIKG